MRVCRHFFYNVRVFFAPEHPGGRNFLARKFPGEKKSSTKTKIRIFFRAKKFYRPGRSGFFVQKPELPENSRRNKIIIVSCTSDYRIIIRLSDVQLTPFFRAENFFAGFFPVRKLKNLKKFRSKVGRPKNFWRETR